MRKKRGALADGGFQRRTAVRVLGVVLAFSVIGLSVLGFHAVRTGRMLASASDGLESALLTGDNIVKAFIRYSGRVGATGLVPNAGKIAIDHELSATTVRRRMADIRRCIFINYAIIGVLGGLFLLQGVFLYRYCIRLTGRIAGPMGMLRRRLEEINRGEIPDFRPLRRDDEFRDVYDQLALAARGIETGVKRRVRTRAKER